MHSRPIRSKSRQPIETTNHWPLIASCGTGLVLVIAAVWWFRSGSQPQLKPDPQVFVTVDALFTAVTSHNSQNLALCEERLKTYAEEGRMPASAYAKLEGIIQKAKAGESESAAKKLYAFMLAQRGE